MKMNENLIELNPKLENTFIQKYRITSREIEIIQKILVGKTNNNISTDLYISIKTVKNHVHNIYQKTGARTRLELATLIRRFNTKSIK